MNDKQMTLKEWEVYLDQCKQKYDSLYFDENGYLIRILDGVHASVGICGNSEPGKPYILGWRAVKDIKHESV